MKLKLMHLNLRRGQLPNLVALRLGIVALEWTLTVLAGLRNQDMMDIHMLLLHELAFVSVTARLPSWRLVWTLASASQSASFGWVG
jgi:hypothetical protein